MAAEPQSAEADFESSAFRDQIWVASYRADDNPIFGSEFIESSLVNWTIEPYEFEEFLEWHAVDTPVVIQGLSKDQSTASIILLGVLGEVSQNGESKPSVEIQITRSIHDTPIIYNLDRYTIPQIDRPAELFLLPPSDSEKFENMLLDAVLDIDEQKTLPDDAKPQQKGDVPPEPDPIQKPNPIPSSTPITTQSRFNTDRPHTVRDSLRRAPNAFVIAQYLNRLRGTPKPHNHHTPQHNDSYVLHVDAPWGGGKTTFANFIANFLTYARKDTPQDQLTFIDDSGVTRDRLNSMADNNWMILHFNAWENQHVSPPWWNFYTSFLKGYKDNIDPLGLTINEGWWRIKTPETIKSVLITAVLTILAVILASATGLLTDLKTLTAAATVFGATSLTAFIFPQAKAGIKRIVDASKSAYNPTVLGEEDPLSRLGERFLEVAGYHNRPVLMVIDDIDRCEPEYVVELMRGLITIFQSNHVSYLILGDRGWIEQSFQNVNDAMADAHSDPTVSFGARFAEKVIQMSYLLPEIPEEERKAYLRSLLSDKNSAAALAEALQKDSIRKDTQSKYENLGSSAAVADTKSQPSSIPIPEDDALAQFQATENRTQAALARATMDDQEAVIRHGLEDLWHLLPENPRRVKRLVNMIAVYQASGETTLGIDPDTPTEWLPMVLWLILFSEYPAVHAQLHDNPKLLDPLPLQPSEPDAVSRIGYDWKNDEGMPSGARAVIDGVTIDGEPIRITSDVAEKMRKLTPLS